jgi:benzoyl-CoA reductase/2-hydroxyglutaryl-CoA dehydratase subunit BcrC/BadD/HgdB
MEEFSVRKQYLADQMTQHQRIVVAAFPIHLPKELFTAFDVVVCEAWDPPVPSDNNPLIQSYVCPVARNLGTFVQSGGLKSVSGAVFPHTCDSLQGLATLSQDFLLDKLPLFHFQQPRTTDKASARTHLTSEIRRLYDWLGQLTGKNPGYQALNAAVNLHEAIESEVRCLWSHRATHAWSDRDLFGLLRRGEFLFPSDFLAELKAFRSQWEGKTRDWRTRIAVSGIFPGGMGLLTLLNSMDACVVLDDYASSGRRIPRIHDESPRVDPPDGPAPMRGQMDRTPADVFASIADRYSSLPPCSTRTWSAKERCDDLLESVRRTGAQGVLMHNITFCEPEAFDWPHRQKALQRAGIPTLALETELSAQATGAVETRLEAFVEMIQSAGGRP